MTYTTRKHNFEEINKKFSFLKIHGQNVRHDSYTYVSCSLNAIRSVHNITKIKNISNQKKVNVFLQPTHKTTVKYLMNLQPLETTNFVIQGSKWNSVYNFFDFNLHESLQSSKLLE